MAPSLQNSSRPPAPEDDEEVDEEFITNYTTLQMASAILEPRITDFLTRPPIIQDILSTKTSEDQDDTVEKCLEYLTGADEDATYNTYGVARLRREKHIRFLSATLNRKFPSGFIAADASRPWFLYWCLSGLVLLGADVSNWRDGVVATARACQNESGGMGGGCGQMSHLATTYAMVLALTLVGVDEEDVYEVVDRKAMWRWLNSLKQPDGGFQVCLGGEEDIRGGYCAAVIVSLLGLPIDLTRESPAWNGEEGRTLFSGLGEYVRRCQTFEGGISGQPEAEAHGAYAFCALGCLSILDAPERIIPKYLDVPRLISWLSSRQYAPEGGFSGRTNKLVDGCYSHWVGGCWPLIEACLNGTGKSTEQSKLYNLRPTAGSLFSREALIRYTFNCCQDFTKKGGLRDKPGKSSDQYHTCYVLSGLSSAQHQWTWGPSTDGNGESTWTVEPYMDGVQVFEEEDRLQPIHPVYVIPQRHVENVQRYFKDRPFS